MLADLQVGQHAQSLQPNTSLISAGSNPTLHRRIAAVPEQRSHKFSPDFMAQGRGENIEGEREAL